VVQLAVVAADPTELEVGETTQVSALVRVTLDTEFASAEFRVADGDWQPMAATLLERVTMQPKDTSVVATTPPFTVSGDLDVCVRATDSLGAVSAVRCVQVAVTGSAGPEPGDDDPGDEADPGDDRDEPTEPQDGTESEAGDDDGPEGAAEVTGAPGTEPGEDHGAAPEAAAGTTTTDASSAPAAADRRTRVTATATELPRTGVPVAVLIALGVLAVSVGSYLRR
jgi:hypothetical protein